MGAVYKARDHRLDRLVAIKVLSEKAAADPERQARLIQEAKAASALNHPHIVTIRRLRGESRLYWVQDVRLRRERPALRDHAGWEHDHVGGDRQRNYHLGDGGPRRPRELDLRYGRGMR